MEIIVGHSNADFDCLGAMVAARRLYPGALLVLPAGEEKEVHDFLARHSATLPPFLRAKDVAAGSVSRLILVDCQQPERIGRCAEYLANPDLSVHIYDHHPPTETSIRADGGCIRSCGSTSTILAIELQKHQLALSPHEATVVMLGIYEDTGKLLFPGTIADDFQAATWLLGQGADLQVVADYVSRGLTSSQVSLLDRLLKNLSHRSINGIPVSISFASCEEYIADISRLSHLMRDMENLDVLFLVVDMGNSVVLVARSRVADVDVGAIMRRFGGGGHTTAASASVRGQSLKQVLENLESALSAEIQPRRTARSLMSSPVKTLPAGTSISAAQETLIRYNCTSMPIMAGDDMVGLISRKTLEKAMYHGLGDEPVDEYMHTDFFRATPETSIAMIQSSIVDGNQRFVPVFEGERLVGAVTRTDLLRYLYNGSSSQPEASYDVETLGFITRHHSLEGLLKKHLPQPTRDLLHKLGATGDSLGLSVYAVGGFVRDLLLGVENFDIDITVEGDGIFLAEHFVARNDCRLRSHHVFGTAVLIFPDGSKVDVASTRLEYYQSPGDLPTVERSSLRHDLYRRDFTINTLAICLNSGRFGVVTDYFGGRQDIQKQVIKVLHNLSFVEDPSRVFRAIRFEQRLHFSISPHTEHLVRSTVRMRGLETLSGVRIFNELVLILKEKDPTAALQRMAAFELLPSLHPALKFTPDTVRILHETGQVLAWFRLMYLPDHCVHWQVYYLAFTSNLTDTDFKALLGRLSVPNSLVERVFGQRGRTLRVCKNLQRAIRHGETVTNSTLHKVLHGLAIESLLYLAALAREDEVRRLVSLYLTAVRTVQPLVDGNALRSLGLPPGPAFRKILLELLNARLDGEIHSREEELARAKILIEQHGLS